MQTMMRTTLLVLALVEGSPAGVPGRRRVLLALPAVAGFALESAVRTAWHAAVRARGWPRRRPRPVATAATA